MYVRKVQNTLRSVAAVTKGMEMGALRADVNVSVRRVADGPGTHSYHDIGGLGQRTEIKNISTVKGVEDAVRAERDRQISVILDGGTVEGETRGWSLSNPNKTRRLRGKEGEVDYRYMPDPDIPPLYISNEVVEHIKSTLPMTPDHILSQLTDKSGYNLDPTVAMELLMVDSGDRIRYFQQVVNLLDSNPSAAPEYGRIAANWVLQELGNLLSTSGETWHHHRIDASDLANIVTQVMKANITLGSGRGVLARIFNGDTRSVDQIIQDENLVLRPMSDQEYDQLATEIMEQHSDVVNEIREKGKAGKINFLVGQMIRRGQSGRMEPEKAQRAIKDRIVIEKS